MKKFLKRTALAVVLALTVIVVVAVYRTLTFTSMQMTPEPGVLPGVNIERATVALSEAVQLQTFSSNDPAEMNPEVFLQLHTVLEQRFPLVHQRLQREKIGGLSLVYRWPGTNPELPAVVLLAHQDVVPAPEPERWEQPPFSGAVVDGFIWGRGTLDDKNCLVGLLEAVESLVEQGFQPQRDIYLCFGHDEETGGWNGAAKVVAVLAERGGKAAFTLDEGLVIVGGDMFGVDQDIALVALTEKGYLSLELTASGEPGHSSTPPKETAVSILAAAITRVAESPMPARMTDPVRYMFRFLGPEMAFPMRAALANLWLTKPLLLGQLASKRTTDAAIRTTTAFTIVNGGHTENVLPATASAVVNYRLLPGDTVAAMIDRTRSLVKDERIAIAPTRPAYASPPPSSVDGPAFAAVHESIRRTFPEVLVAPGMMLGGSDSHHYHVIAENIFGFQPIRLTPEDLERIHGHNERIGIQAFERMIVFYATLLQTAAG